MLKTKLNSFVSILYHWIQAQSYDNLRINNLNIDNFISWASEFMESKPSQEQVLVALSKLQSIDLITVEGNQIIVNNNLDESKPQIQSLPTAIIRSKANNPWLWGAIVVISLLGLSTASMLLSKKITSISQESGHTTVINNPYQILGEKE